MADDLTNTYVPLPNGILSNQPKDVNFLSPLGFRFSLRRSPHVNFFCTDASIPNFELGTAEMPSPFKIIPLPGDKPRFGDLTLTFKLDEKLQNYLEIFNWMVKIGFPESYDQYASIERAPIGSGQGVVSDATVTILNSSMDPTTEFRFQNMYPVSLSDLNFTTTDTTVNYITARASFRFEMMRVVPL